MKHGIVFNKKAFTLVELIIVMAISIIVLLISASAFENVIKISTGVTKSAQSQIEGIVGLEILRKDLNAVGYGLPWSFQTTPDPAKYLEADLDSGDPIKGLNANDFNDAPDIPRAVVLGSVPGTQDTIYAGTGMNSNPGSDYLVIKATNVAFNTAVGKWGYVNYSSLGTKNLSYIAKWNSAEDLDSNDVVITHKNTFSGTNQARHVLAMNDVGDFSYNPTQKDAAGHFMPPDSNYTPSGNIVTPLGVRINNEEIITYAIRKLLDKEKSGTSFILRMPFNRADYFVMRPTGKTMSSKCNRGTGILYKAVITNSMGTNGSGEQVLYPLLDCVGDMQVVFDMQDPNDADKTITQDNLKIVKSGVAVDMNAEEIRTYLKAIRVYLLVHEGGRDNNYKYPFTDANNVISVSENSTSSLGRIFKETDMVSFFGPDWRKYRWKVYSVVGQPYNLLY